MEPLEIRNVVNLSTKQLTSEESKVLSLGLNFALCPKHVPIDEIISRMEQIAGMIKADGQLLREEVSRCLRKMRPITPTLKKIKIERPWLIFKRARMY